MDNGHTTGTNRNNGIFSGSNQYQQSVGSPYFTAGEGDAPVSAVNVAMPPQTQAPEVPITSEIPPAPAAPETTMTLETPPAVPEIPAAPVPESLEPLAKNPYELGQITPVTSANPPKTDAKNFTPTPIPEPFQKYNKNNIRTTGDHLEKSAISEVDNVINELNQTGDLNSFYNEIRGTDETPGMMEVNLGNSFNRKLGSDQGGEK